jgi:hypothetical protein
MRYITDSGERAMRACLILLTISVTALSQEAPVVANTPVTISSGVPLRVALEHRVRIKHVGQPIQGRLVEPVYAFDQMVLSAGSIVEGHIAEIGRVPIRRRFTALLSGNLTPPRDVRAQFDTLVLDGGSRLPLHTSLSRGTAHIVRVSMRGKKPDALAPTFENRAAALAFTPPSRLSQLKTYLFGMLPYHRQAWSPGTLFDNTLQEPLKAPAGRVAAQTGSPAAKSEDRELLARLLNPISSATARKGAKVEAVVTRPLFANDHALLIPEGSHLVGEIVQAQHARIFHRNGKLLFVFRQISLPARAPQEVHGYLKEVETNFDAHLALDSEGEAHIASPKTRFIFPAIAAAVAGLSFHQDYNAKGVPDLDSAGRAESGAVGLGLIGTAVAQISRPVASGIAITGVAFSIYSTFIASGSNVVFPVNTALKVSLGPSGAEAVAGSR